MLQTGLSLVFLLAGLALVVFHRQFGSAAVRSQNGFWGFKFGNREERISSLIGLAVGVGWVLLGGLALVGVVHFR